MISTQEPRQPSSYSRASELRYRRLFEAAQDGIIILDADTRKIIDANPFILELLGYAHNEIIGKELWEIGLLKDRGASEAAFRQLRESGYIRYENFPLRTAAGVTREVEFVSNVYQEDDLTVIQCNIRDISERLELRRQREILTNVEHLASLGQMASGTAHDINQSLAIVAGYSDVGLAALAGSDLDPGMLRDTFEIIAQAAMDAGEVIKGLLTHARGRVAGPPEAVRLDSLLAEVKQLTAPRWRHEAQVQGRTITVKVDVGSDAIILGWPASAREALTNLIFNATDALPEGGAIALRAHRRGDEICVDVADSGIGMSRELQAQIFEPFFTTKGKGGTGLGLAQVVRAVNLHGGRISVESAPDRGTTFHMAFPCIVTDLAQVSVRNPLRTTSPLRILAVDDEPALARLIGRMLGPGGHTVVEAHSGAEAVDRLAVEPFDLIVSDLGMPGMTGWELAAHVRHQYPTIPVVLATGWGAQVTPEEVQAHGVHAVIAKPYRLADLQAAIASLDPPE